MNEKQIGVIKDNDILRILQHSKQLGLDILNPEFFMDYIFQILNQPLIEKFKIVFDEFAKNGVDVVDFTRILLNIIDHNKDQTIYLTIVSIKFFKSMSQSLKKNTIHFKDFVHFATDVNELFSFTLVIICQSSKTSSTSI